MTSLRPRIASLLCAGLMAWVAAAWAQPAADKSGVKPNVLSLPTGAGSVEGLGESFEPQLNSGTGSYRVAIAVPPGRAGFAPSLALNYSTGGGNSEFGIGWSLGVPAITRQTDKGIPRYDGTDVFLFRGEELAQLSDGTWRCENEESFVRLRREGLGWIAEEKSGTKHYFGTQTRVRRGPTDSFDETYCWHLDRSVDLNGNVIRYQYEEFEDSPGRLYCSAVRYNENDAGTRYFEARFHYDEGANGGREVGTWTGLAESAARIRNAYAAFDTELDPPADWTEFFEIAGAATRPDALSDFRAGFHQRWGRRCTAVSVHQENTLIRHYRLEYADQLGDTARAQIEGGFHPFRADRETVDNALSLLSRVTVFGKNAAPPYDESNLYRLPSLTFDYTRLAMPGEAPVLRAVNAPRYGLGDPNTDLIDINGDGLPDIVHLEPGDSVYWLNEGVGLDGNLRFSSEQQLINMPGGIRLSDSHVQFADLDGNSATDLVIYKGPGDQNIAVYTSPVHVASNYTSDGHFQEGFARFGAEQSYTGPALFSLGAPNVQFLDLNFDKFIDVLVGDPFGFTYYLNDRGTAWTDLGSTDFGEATMADMPASVQFGTPGVQLADMNGDRLQDVVQLQVDDGRAVVRYWHGRGERRWDRARVMVGLTFTFSSNVEDLRVMDVNGDGLADLVALGTGVPNSRLRYWINRGNGTYSDPVTFDESNSLLPEYTADTAIRTADMNGNNMTDLVYSNGTRLEFLDFSAGGPKPNMLSLVDNGIGKRVVIDYKSSTDHMLDARDAGAPWRSVMPMPVPVVTNIVSGYGPVFDLNEDGNSWEIEGIEHGFDLNGDGTFDETYTSSIRYRDGFYDPFEKEFRGFRYAEKLEWGDDYLLKWQSPYRAIPDALLVARTGLAKSVTLISRFRFHLGDADGINNDEGGGPIDERTELGGSEEEALKGKPLWEEKVDGAALADGALNPGDFADNSHVYSRVEYEYLLRRLHKIAGDNSEPSPAFVARSQNGRQVTFPMMVRARTTEIEANGYLQSALLLPAGLSVPVRDPVEFLSEVEYDSYGNTLIERNWGIVTNGGLTLADRQAFDDERFTSRQFIYDTANWIVDRAFEESVTDEFGAFVARSQTHYDGADFVGLPTGTLGARGLPSRVVQYINGATPPPDNTSASDVIGDADRGANTAISVARTAYDDFGNAVAMLDPLGDVGDLNLAFDSEGRKLYSSATVGHLRTILYDEEYATYPIAELIHLEDGKTPLLMQAMYDKGLGVMVNSTDFNGNISTYGYDVYGRLTSIVKPGDDPLAPGMPLDTFANPSQVFQYVAADPWTGTRYLYDRDGALDPPVSAGVAPLLNTVRTFLREDFSNADGYHTLDAFKYTDGLGRTLLEVGEPESIAQRIDALDTGPPVASATRYGLRAAAWTVEVPYFGSSQLADLYIVPPVASEERTETYPDALGRPVMIVLPPESGDAERDTASLQAMRGAHVNRVSPARFDPSRRFTVTFNLPRETHSYDEEQTRPASRHFGAHMEHFKDGLDRLIKVHEVVRIETSLPGGSITNGDVNTSAGPTEGDPFSVALGAPEEWVTQYDYDLQDNLVHIRDSQNNQKWMRHDGLGRKLFMNDPDRGVMLYSYDDASNLVETRDAKNQVIAYGYDGANRLRFEDYIDAGQPFSFNRDFDPMQPISTTNRADVHYYYDSWAAPVEQGNGGPARTPRNTSGMLTAVEDLTGAEYFSYDQRGRTDWRVKAVADPTLDPGSEDWWLSIAPYSFQFRYDAMDRVRDMVYPDNDALHYEYNDRGEINGIIGGLTGEVPGKVILDNYDAIASGQEQSRRLGNGVLTLREYDPRLRMDRLTHLGPEVPETPRAEPPLTRRGRALPPATIPLIDYGYEFDGASNILQIEDKRPKLEGQPGYIDPLSERRNTQLFQYDDLYRLTQVVYPRGIDDEVNGGQIDYRYDRIGNMLRKFVPAEGQDGHWSLEEDGKSVVHLGAMSYGEGMAGPAGRFGRVGRASSDTAGPHALTSTESGREYVYDANGNMQQIEEDAATWDFKDRLFALNNEERRADYRYDYSDRRTTKYVRPRLMDGSIDADAPTTVTVYVDLLFELREGNNPVKYVFLGDERIARTVGGLAPMRDRVQKLRYSRGWNLVAPAVTPAAGLTARHVFGWDETFNPVAGVFRFDNATQAYVAVQPDDALALGEGYWVAALAPATRSVLGSYIDLDEDPQDIPLPPGLSLAGWPRLEPMRPAENLVGVDIAIGFDAGTQNYRTILREDVPEWVFTPQDKVEAGSGFFVRSDGAGEPPGLGIPTEQPADLLFPLPDHLGSHQSLIDSVGAVSSEMVTLPYGASRAKFEAASLATGFGYQFIQKERDAESGLQYFEARYLLSPLARFVSVDPVDLIPRLGEIGLFSADPQRDQSQLAAVVLSALDPSDFRSESLMLSTVHVSGSTPESHGDVPLKNDGSKIRWLDVWELGEFKMPIRQRHGLACHSYDYANANPLTLTDSSGGYPLWFVGILVGVVAATVVDVGFELRDRFRDRDSAPEPRSAEEKVEQNFDDARDKARIQDSEGMVEEFLDSVDVFTDSLSGEQE